MGKNDGEFFQIFGIPWKSRFFLDRLRPVAPEIEEPIFIQICVYFFNENLYNHKNDQNR